MEEELTQKHHQKHPWDAAVSQDAATKLAVLSAAIFGCQVNPVSRQELLRKETVKKMRSA